jgi:hypothetical protein
MKFDGKWKSTPPADHLSDGGPWTPLWEQAGDVMMGYKVFGDDSRQVAFRTATFLPVLAPGQVGRAGLARADRALQGSSTSAWRRRRRPIRSRIRLRQEAAAAEQKRVADEAAEKPARRPGGRRREAAAAQEEAQAKAAAARKTRLLAVLAPFQSGTALVTTDAGAAMGALLSDVKIDEEKFTVAGKGLSLRDMPFREFTFDARSTSAARSRSSRA